jgi:ACT domain-containing protein
MSIDICDLTITIDELIEKIKLLEGIKSVDIMGVE